MSESNFQGDDVQSNSTSENIKPSNERKLSNMVNGGTKISTDLMDRSCYPGKTMYVMPTGPKKYQTIKKSPDKEPKFVPYEPYKAAVRSIVPELSQPSIAVFKRRLSTTSTCSKTSNFVEEDEITKITQEKQVMYNFNQSIEMMIYIIVSM